MWWLRDRPLKPVRGATRLGALDGHTNMVAGLVFHPKDSNVLFSTSMDSTVRKWDVAGRREVRQEERHTNSIWGYSLSADGATLVTGGAEGRVIIWSTSTLEPVKLSFGDFKAVNDVALSADGKTLAVLDDNVLGTWTFPDAGGTGVPFTNATHTNFAVFHPSDSRVLATNMDNDVRLWNVGDGRPTGPDLKGSAGSINNVAFSPDGTRLAAVGDDTCVRIWDTATHAQIGDPLRGHVNPSIGVAFSPDGRTLASGGGDAKVCLWDVAGHAAIGSPLGEHSRPVQCVAFSPDGRLLASGDNNGQIIIWRLER